MAEVVPPDERECLRCGRKDVWDETRETWVTADGDGTAGTPHCLHEWDINGAYNPVQE